MWKDVKTPPEEGGLYLVAVVASEGEKLVATALYERENGRDFWEIQHTYVAVYNGKIKAWKALPEFPKEFE